MSLRSRLKNPTTMMRVGMSFLILASLTRWFVKPGVRLSPGLVDLASGALYGVSIGCLLLSVMLNRRRRSRVESDPPA